MNVKLMVMLISEIYHSHPRTLPVGATIYQAVQELMKDEVNALVIVDDHHQPVGVLSLPDVAAATIPRQFRQNVQMAAAMYRRGFFTEICQQLKDNPVMELMRRSFLTVSRHDNIMTVTADFLRNDLYLVPVVDDGRLIGVVTRTEIKQALLYGMRNLPAHAR